MAEALHNAKEVIESAHVPRPASPLLHRSEHGFLKQVLDISATKTCAITRQVKPRETLHPVDFLLGKIAERREYFGFVIAWAGLASLH